jgi:N-methylhydantoinase A
MVTKMTVSNPTQSFASKYRLGVDIGCTFTDVALEISGRRFTRKVLTTSAPEQGVLQAIRAVLADAALTPADLSIIIHGTT